MANNKKKVKEMKVFSKGIFEEKKNDTITYECLSCGVKIIYKNAYDYG
ncbi:hypothetical protein [Clostridium sp. JS66]|nr:hypothetical protein [Clostridium sp. JS66]WPC43252.1 hypothetical protein Q6H37_07200 [Clostridium sp. JS66]